MNTKQINDIIEIKSERRALELLEDMLKEHTLTAAENGSNVFRSMTPTQLKGRRKLVYSELKLMKRADRHQIEDSININRTTPVSSSSICGRLSELLKMGLVEVVAQRIGAYGKSVSVYKVVA